MLSHDPVQGLTTGFCKGTPSSDIVRCIKHLKTCAADIAHPMLFPIIIFSHDMDLRVDLRQRHTRDWLRRLEHAVSLRSEIIEEKEGYVQKDGPLDLDALNRDLVECHSQVLWKRPKGYLEIVDGFQKTLSIFEPRVNKERKAGLMKLHRSMEARMDFYKCKIQGLESYSRITLARLEIQRSAVSS